MKKNQIYNPFLPLYEYIPDGEPHVFGDLSLIHILFIIRTEITMLMLYTGK